MTSKTPRVDNEILSTKAAVRNYPALEREFEKYQSMRDLARNLETELVVATTFQPITADTPTGYGNDILLCVKGSRPWIDYLGGSDMSDAQCRRDAPTHWAPLPKTPEG